MDDVQGVDDIAQRLAHLPAMCISHDGMEVDLRHGRGCEVAPPCQTPLLSQGPASGLPRSEPQSLGVPASPFSTFMALKVLPPLESPGTETTEQSLDSFSVLTNPP